MYRCHVAICRDRLPIVLARPCVVHVCRQAMLVDLRQTYFESWSSVEGERRELRELRELRT
jgi:hypothetical protein